METYLRGIKMPIMTKAKKKPTLITMLSPTLMGRRVDTELTLRLIRNNTKCRENRTLSFGEANDGSETLNFTLDSRKA